MVDQSPEFLHVVGIVYLDSFIVTIMSTFFYGIFTILICCSTYLLCQKQLTSRVNLAMLIITLSMFLASTVAWALVFMIIIESTQELFILHSNQLFQNKVFKINKDNMNVNIIESFMQQINFFLGDGIVVWRAWTLWQKRKVMALPLSLLLISAITSIVSLVLIIISLLQQSPQLLNIFGITQVTVWGLELMINLSSTLLIAYQAWTYRQSIKTHLSKHKKTRVEIILALLIESGFIYCGLWIMLIALDFNAPDNYNFIMASSMHLAGIYPTSIVILVTIDSTIVEMSRIPTPVAQNLAESTPGSNTMQIMPEM